MELGMCDSGKLLLRRSIFSQTLLVQLIFKFIKSVWFYVINVRRHRVIKYLSKDKFSFVSYDI